jgi:hypothetical protein
MTGSAKSGVIVQAAGYPGLRCAPSGLQESAFSEPAPDFAVILHGSISAYFQCEMPPESLRFPLK